jgi:hypothetical protein
VVPSALPYACQRSRVWPPPAGPCTGAGQGRRGVVRHAVSALGAWLLTASAVLAQTQPSLPPTEPPPTFDALQILATTVVPLVFALVAIGIVSWYFIRMGTRFYESYDRFDMSDDSPSPRSVNQTLGQVSDPLRVVDVGLAARYGLQMLRVDQQQLEAFLEHVEDRLPVTAGALHREVRHAPLRQPLAQRGGNGSRSSRQFKPDWRTSVEWRTRSHDERAGRSSRR